MGHLSLILEFLLLTVYLTSVAAEDDTLGPIFIKEPPNRIDFSNTTGAQVECTARGSPNPEIIWIRSDGTAVGDVPGLRKVLPNGNLEFPPFRAEDYRQEVHAQVYVCMARNSVGSINSRDVNVRAVVSQVYETDVNKEYTIRGNSAILKCQIPSFVADFVSVISWHTDQDEVFTYQTEDVVQQLYATEVNNEYVIQGNSAVLKCSIPSFVADYVIVVSWQDDSGNTFTMHSDYVVQQHYTTEVNNEHVIQGNSAVLKCVIPSFVADYVMVVSWQDEVGESYTIHDNSLVVNQYYEAEVVSEYVIKGNTAVLKCNIPSFVTDFVKVEAWISSDGEEYLPRPNFVVNQIFEADILPEYVIRGNTGILKCNIPSFVTEFVHVDAWISDEGEVQNVVNQAFEAEILTEYVIRGNAGILKCSIPSFVADYVLVDAWINDEGAIVENVVSQDYVTEAENEYVIRGNSAVMKCKIPSFVSDFVSIDAWLSDEGEELSLQSASHDYVVSQQYSTGSEEEYVIKGNSATLKCKIPSFVNDFVTVDSWLDSEGNVYSMQDTPDYVVTQQYEAEADNEYVIRGNSVAMKCEIPSFVADFVSVLNWSDSDGNEFLPGEEIVIQQFYQTRVNDEFVLIGNSATLKCLIPSFVADFVSIAEWLDDEGTSYTSQGIVVHQSYQTQVIDEYVLRGNSATLKCLVPSFVADFVQVTEWMDEEGRTFRTDDDTSVDVISQYYEAQVYDVFVIKGNAAVFKCNLPSFVSDHLDVVSWADTDGGQYQIDNQDFVVSQSYTVNIMDEHVLKGNSAVLKCHIPSFVADYVAVESWISDLGEELFVDMTESTGAAQLS
ncbi:hypothetical protein M8J76_008755 [Diaphorina citri]|nr:hypothetical protein M8J76_008755 [Diaphorina citri]